MKSKSVAFASLALAVAATVPAVSQADDGPAWGPFTANIALTSDYRFRGQSQSQGEPAISGGVDYAGSSGFFAGVWASNVDFNDAADTYMELDLYAGFTGALSDKTTGTIKAIYYLYPAADYPPGGDEYDYFELIGSLAHDFGGFSSTLEVAWSPDYFLKSGSSVALTGGVSVPITDSFWFFDGGVSASGKFGYQWIEENATFGAPDYAFYDIGLSAKVANVTFDVRWVDTDLDLADCFGGTNLCEGGVVATLTLLLPG
ncbi:MAG: TorF family putative porin [Micropepsaceae bacterium]